MSQLPASILADNSCLLGLAATAGTLPDRRAQQTADFRTRAFVEFLSTINVDNNSLTKLSSAARSGLLLLFFSQLRTSKPLLRSATLKAYLASAAAYITSLGLYDPRYTDSSAPPGRSILPRFVRIFREMERWENMASRQDPVTRGMALWLRAATLSSPLASEQRAIANWIALGLSAGVRISEYGQPSSKIMYLPKSSPFRGLPRVFIADDFVFHSSPSGVPLQSPSRTAAQYVTIRWRVQKNGHNGETVTFAAIPATSPYHLLCPVRNALNTQHSQQGRTTSV